MAQSSPYYASGIAVRTIEDDSPSTEHLVNDALEVQLHAARIIRDLRAHRLAQSRVVYDAKKKKAPIWPPGQVVFIRREVFRADLSRKFLCQWAGPFKITERITPVVYGVDLGNGRTQSWHVSRLLPFTATTHPLSPLHYQVDLFDFDESLEGCEPDPELVPKPATLGEHVLVRINGQLRVGQLVDLDVSCLEGQTFDRVHLFDTVNLGAENLDPKRWEQSWFPTYCDPATGGIAVKKPQDADDWTPVLVEVNLFDRVGVSFSLTANHQLKPVQRRVVDSWEQLLLHPESLPSSPGLSEFFVDAADDVL